ncbi:hypothetical protein FJY94_01325 [Candidatus Kaiserbacteria bacterium]|nr:hypothetical protein [Candidatus Kaiserbacteria bacterium]
MKYKSDFVHPVTGESDTIGTIRYVTDFLCKQKSIERGGLYHTLPGSMKDRLGPLHIKSMPELLLLMQELCLLRHRGGHNTTVWQVACTTYFEEFVSEEWVARARHNLQKRREMLAELDWFKKQSREPVPGSRDAPDNTIDEQADPQLIEQMAEMVAEVERLRGECASKDGRIGTLEAELAERPKDNPRAVAAALVERFRQVKTA